MPAGDKTLAPRPRAATNERLDLVDHAALALATQLGVEAATRSLLATPKAAAGVATGERWAGSMTANPTGAADGLFRLDSAVFVGVDSNGGMIVKPNGTALSVAIPAGGASYQVYVYAQDVAEDTQVRRFLPATAPFTEFPAAIDTAIRQTATLYVRAGALGTVVAEDAIASATRALLFLGIAVNVAGAVTFTPGINTLETVTAPTTVPTTNSGTTTVKTTVTGSSVALRDLVNAALYLAGNSAWKGSDFLTPAIANNFGAYQLPAGGTDKAFRQAVAYVTIGDGVTVFGDFNTNAYGNAKLLLDAVIAALPAYGGTIFFKRGVVLTGFGASTVTLPAGKVVALRGESMNQPTAHITFAAGEWFILSVNSAVSFVDIKINHVANAILINDATAACSLTNVLFTKTAGTDTGAAITGVNIADFNATNVTFWSGITAASANAMGIRLTGTASRVRIRDIKQLILNRDCGCISIADVRQDVLIDTVFIYDGGATLGGSGAASISLNSTDNVTQVHGRVVRNVVSLTANVDGININSIGHLTMSGLHLASTVGVVATAYAGTGPVAVVDSTLVSASVLGAVVDIRFNNVRFTRTTNLGNLVIGSFASAVGLVVVRACKFPSANAVAIHGSTLTLAWIDDCEFDGCADATTSDWSCVKVHSTTAQTVRFSKNIIRNFQNIVYAGGAVNSHRIFEFDGSAKSLECKFNTAYNLMQLSSGLARFGVYLLDVDSVDRATVTGSVGTLICCDNVIGEGTTDVCMIANVKNIGVGILAVDRNMLRTCWDSTVGVSAINVLCSYNNGAIGTDVDTVSFDHNKIRINITASITLTKDILKVSGAGGGSLENVSIQSNQIRTTSGATTWDFVNGWGFQIPAWTISNLCFKHNTANRNNGADADTWLKTRLTGTVHTSIPAVATASASWADNIHLSGVVV